MKYLLAILLNLFYAFCFEVNVPSFIVVSITTFMLFLFYHYAVKNNSKSGAFLELLCITLPFAWRSIYGTSFSSFSISWFYLVGLVFFLMLIFSKNLMSVRISKQKAYSLLCIIFLLGWGIIPLIKSYNFYDGLTEYIMYAFFYLLLFASIFHEGSLSRENKDTVLRMFTIMTMYCAIAISTQYVLAYFGINIFKYEMFGSDNVRHAYAYMFEDMSSASIILVSGAMVCLIYGKRIFKYPNVIMTTIIIGTVLSSTRTGIVAFGIIAIIFILFNRNSKYKFIKVIFIFLLAYVVVSLYSLIRPMDSISTIITYDNGRFDLIANSILLFLEYPFFGTGFDSSIFIRLTGLPTVGHTYILTVLTMTGVFYTIVFVVFILICLREARMKGNNEEIWIIILAFVGSCFIPNLMGTRYLVILFLVIFLSANTKQPYLENVKKV